MYSCRHLLAFLLLQHFFDMDQTSIPFARWSNPKFRHRLRVLLHDDFPPLRKNKGYFSRSVFDDVELSCCSTLGFLFGVAFGVVFGHHGCTEQVVAANVTVVGTLVVALLRTGGAHVLKPSLHLLHVIGYL